jgi:hypothetical protein
LVIIFAGALKSGIQSLNSQIDRSRWWTSLAPVNRYLILGVFCEGLGILLLQSRLKRRAPIQGLLGLRLFLGEIAMIVVGAVWLLKAGGW